MLEYAWFLNNKQGEVKAYDMLAINYFNLGELKKSNYFHSKAMK